MDDTASVKTETEDALTEYIKNMPEGNGKVKLVENVDALTKEERADLSQILAENIKPYHSGLGEMGDPDMDEGRRPESGHKEQEDTRKYGNYAYMGINQNGHRTLPSGASYDKTDRGFVRDNPKRKVSKKQRSLRSKQSGFKKGVTHGS